MTPARAAAKETSFCSIREYGFLFQSTSRRNVTKNEKARCFYCWFHNMGCNPTVKIQIRRDGYMIFKYRFLILFHRNKGVDHRHRKSRPGTVYHENCAIFTFWRFLADCSRSVKIESSKKLLYLRYGKAPSNIGLVPTPEIATIFFKPRDSPRGVYLFVEGRG